LSIVKAMRYVARKPDPLFHWPPVPPPPEGARTNPAVLRQLEEEQEAWEEWWRSGEENRARAYLLNKAEKHAKMGDPSKPSTVKVSDEEWHKVYADEVEWRTRQAAHMMAELLEYLDQTIVPEMKGYRPEEAGNALARITGEGRALTILRDGVAWLQRVLEEAERQQGRIQGGA
jgi:hypothetical protein